MSQVMEPWLSQDNQRSYDVCCDVTVPFFMVCDFLNEKNKRPSGFKIEFGILFVGFGQSCGFDML